MTETILPSAEETKPTAEELQMIAHVSMDFEHFCRQLFAEELSDPVAYGTLKIAFFAGYSRAAKCVADAVGNMALASAKGVVLASGELDKLEAEQQGSPKEEQDAPAAASESTK